MTGTSKQNFHQQLNRWLDQKEEQAALIPLIYQIRKEHPHMSARLMYKKLCPNTMGRDKFEGFCFENGFKVTCPRDYRRTTDSSGVERFPNLIEGRELTGVNRVFVSDITYYEMNKKFSYITFIMDLYTREVVGYSKSKSLRTAETAIPAIKMMARNIGPAQLEGAIFHSDGGGQYYSKEFLVLTAMLKMKNSMAKLVYDNSHAERINGIIKNDYLIPYGPQNDAQLGLDLIRAVKNYNTGKPHGSLGGLAPVEFRKTKCNKPLFIKKITTTISVDNISPGYCPTLTIQPNYEVNPGPF